MLLTLLSLIFLSTLSVIISLTNVNVRAAYSTNDSEISRISLSNSCPILQPIRETSDQIFTFDLVFEWGDVSPDNFKQKGILTNGQFPGPAITVERYSTLIVNVVNKLDEGFTLHFHGIHQHGTLSADGVPGVTQYQIPPCGQYRHVIFIGPQFGTFFYHAHTEFHLNWAFGALIINDPLTIQVLAPYRYDHEKTILLSQCYHASITDIVKGLRSSPFEDVPDTFSLLTNGKSWEVWNSTNRNESATESSGDTRNVQHNGYEVISVRQHRKYRLRVIGFGVDSMLKFYIKNHTFTIIEVDGILVVPVKTDHLQINTAQRYSVILETNQPIGNYEIITEMIPGPGPKNGFAILHYHKALPTGGLRHQLRPGETPEVEIDQWILNRLYPNPIVVQQQQNVYPIPTTVDREIIIESHMFFTEDGHARFDINGQFHEQEKIPYLFQLRSGVSLANQEPKIFEILYGESIQIVLQNTFSDEGECEQHPWHMHGHSFYVVATGLDLYDPIKDKATIDANVKSGRLQLRDVGTLFTGQAVENKTTGAPCGWLAIRFLANNIGIWIVHCHLTAHQILGKWFLLYEHREDDELLLGTI